MQLKKYSCLLLVCVIVFSCLSVPAVAMDTEKQITESCKQKSIAEIKKSRKNCATEKGHDKNGS